MSSNLLTGIGLGIAFMNAVYIPFFLFMNTNAPLVNLIP
jgi:hypothetical protein